MTSWLTNLNFHRVRLGVSRLILGCRNLQKGNAAKDAIGEETTSKATTIEVWELDLANYQSVLAFAKRVRTSLKRLDAFISNAGVELVEFTTAEGIETTLTVNVVSTMLLNIAVLPKLRETSAEHGITTTLSTVGSSVHIFGSHENLAPPKGKGVDTFDMLSDPASADMGGPETEMGPRYVLSKTILHAVLPHLASRASRPGRHEQVIVNWLNPGWCTSEIARHKVAAGARQRVMFTFFGRTTEQGSRALVHAIVAGKETHGSYLSECRAKPQAEFLRSQEGVDIGQRLWEELMVRIDRISPETSGFLE